MCYLIIKLSIRGDGMIDRTNINLFEFVEYNLYLRELYENSIRKDPSFSYRKMSALFGFTSPNYCKLLIDGDRHLARKSFPQIFKALKFKDHEEEYFSYLVEFARSKTSKEKNFYFGKIVRFRSDRSISLVRHDQFDYFSNWYNVAIRELLCNTTAPVDPAIVAKALRPTISEEQAAQAIELLLSIGFLHIAEGKYLPLSPLLNTKSELSSVAIRGFHRQMLGLAQESLDSFPIEQREFSAVTLTLSEQGYERMKQKLQEFREEALHIACDDQDVDRVIQLNMHMFPLAEEKLK